MYGREESESPLCAKHFAAVLACTARARLQSFYQAESLGEGTGDQPTDGSKSSSSWYGSFRPKARQLPPIFSSLSGRGSEAVSIDKRIRDANSLSELLSIIKDRVETFDEGSLVIALCTGAKMVDDRSFSSLSSNHTWLLLHDRLCEAIPRLEPRGLSMVAYAIAKLGENKEVMLAELARVSILKAADFSATDVAKICWAFSKLDFIDGALNFWKEMANVVLKQVATARHVELSMIAWAFGTAQQGHPAMYAEIADCALRTMQELTPQCLANVAVAFARQNLSYPELFGAISRRAMTVIKDFADFDATNLCWAQARAQQVDHELFHQLATHTVASRYVKRYSAEMAAQMCWAFAVAKVQHEGLFSELTDFIARHASVFEVQYVANCAWSYASLGVRDNAAWQALARECKGGRLWRYPEDQLSAVCWAFARIRWHDAELFQDMLQVASHRLPEFQPQSLINFLSAVIVLWEEDWLSTGSFEDLHEIEAREDLKEILEGLVESVLAELKSSDKKLQVEELAMVEHLLDRTQEWRGKVSTREGRQNAAKVNLAAEDPLEPDDLSAAEAPTKDPS